MNAAPDRLAIAAALREAGLLLGLRGDDRFRAKAYARGARALERTSEDLGQLVSEGRLTSIRGIGPALAAVITEIRETGRSRLLDRLRAENPAPAAELLQVPGMTRKRVAALRATLGISSVPELEAAAREGRIRAVKGFGEKTERRILEGIAQYESGGTTVLLVDALEAAEAFRDWLRALPGCVAAEITGSVRRMKELVSNVDLVTAFRDPAAACGLVARYPPAARVESEDAGFCALRLADGLAARVTLVHPGAFGSALQETTGSAAHLAGLRGLGARGPDGGGVGDEREVYARMGLPFIPPELREGAGEIEAALAGETFDDLVTIADIRGMVHCHTTWSDGKSSVLEMARAAEAMGMRFITITDHSPTASYAGGLDPARLRRQWDDIDRAQEQVGIRILKGTESDILQDGSLDYPDDILRRLDVVIASVHVRHKMDAAQMTDRVIRAMRQPVFKIWGHALGRLLRRREPFACDVEAVLDAIAGSRAAIEINGDPYRLDMEPRWIMRARARNIRFVISTDAHSTGQLQNLRFGVGIARRGGVRRREVLNARDAAGFAKAVRPALS